LHGASGFLLGLHERHQDVFEADVQHLLDQHGIIGGRTHDRLRVGVLKSLQLADQGVDGVWGVLRVEQHPVELMPADHLGEYVAATGAPDADLR
jgi:hypothetical protein